MDRRHQLTDLQVDLADIFFTLDAAEVASALDDHLYALNIAIATESVDSLFPKAPREYLEDWAANEAGLLRRFYPPGDGEVHYEVTPPSRRRTGGSSRYEHGRSSRPVSPPQRRRWPESKPPSATSRREEW